MKSQIRLIKESWKKIHLSGEKGMVGGQDRGGTTAWKENLYFLIFVIKHETVMFYPYILHVKTSIIEQHLPLFNQEIWIVRM